MRVTVIAQTENPINTCAAAAWGCTHRESRDSDNFTLREASSLVERVVALGHKSILEHANFTVLVEGISRACSHQLVRSRIASYSQQSQRYVEFNDLNVVTPKTITDSCKAQAHFDNVLKTIYLEYKTLINMGIPAEDARYILPNASQTNITITMNARSWICFFQQRCCLKAQWEIRDMATEIYKQLYLAAPPLFNSAKIPNCGSKGECNTCVGVHKLNNTPNKFTT